MTKSAIVREARIIQTFVGVAFTVAMVIGLVIGGF
jgi:hypothetical protein